VKALSGFFAAFLLGSLATEIGLAIGWFHVEHLAWYIAWDAVVGVVWTWVWATRPVEREP
jgi:hypothetical protein